MIRSSFRNLLSIPKPTKRAIVAFALVASTAVSSATRIQVNNNWPAGEAPAAAINGYAGKYLNFGGSHTGIIVTPLKGSTVADQIILWAANDSPDRDPLFYQVLGTNRAISGSEFDSADFKLIAQGRVNLPAERSGSGTAALLESRSWSQSFENEEAFTSYLILFPALKGATSTMMQVAEIQLRQGETPIFAAGDPVLGVKAERAIVEFTDPDTTPIAGQETNSLGIVFIPDTQFYARYAAPSSGNQFASRYGTNPFEVQTEWIARFAGQLQIPLAIHLGDIVDRANVAQEWTHASGAMAILDNAGVPYSILAGNHDVWNSGQWSGQRNAADEPYLSHFPASRAEGQSTFEGMSADGFCQYHVFDYQGQSFLHLALSWLADESSVQWAQQVIDAHPTLPVILSTHDYLAIDSDGITARSSSYGDYLWENLVKKNDQIFMGIGGHNHGSAHRVRKNDFGHDVLEVVVDYQMSYQGGNGYLRLCEFDFQRNVIRSTTFSPWVPTKPEESLNEFDLAILDDAANQYEVPMNFAQRFAGFAPDFQPGTINRGRPLTDTVREMILANFEQPESAAPVLPFDSEDYPHNGNLTLAHWRFDTGISGQAVADGTRVADLSPSGLNTLVRTPISGEAQPGDLVWSSDSHSLSAAGGSVRFVGRDTISSGRSHFQTLASAPLNQEFLREGYTVEAIFKIDPEWSATTNAWMFILGRDGKRGELPNWGGGYAESPPLQFAISNLREVQWEPTMFSSGGSLYAAAAWSGEIMNDTWTHVAIVNDPSSKNTTMYVAGAPVLRNVNSADGIAGFPENPWTIGAGMWNNFRSGGFFGNLSEIRVSKGALAPDQWLTARKHRVTGTGGRQNIVGTDGDDQIAGNAAADTLTGGAGADTFVFRSTRDGMDTITDFEPGMDVVNIVGLMQELGYAGEDAFGDGVLRLVDSARGVVLQHQVSGHANSYRNLILFNNVTADDLTGKPVFIY